MSKTSLWDRLRYAFDNSLSKGPVALIGWLALASAALILAASLFLWATGIAPQPNLIDLLWMNLLHTLGRSIPDGDNATWPYRLFMLAVTFGSIFITGTLIGVLTAITRSKIEDLRKGRSKVTETGHTVILGWAPHIFSIISELVAAKANQPKSCIVILGDKDKVEMEEEIRDKVGSTGRTRAVCRRGSPIEMSDLDIVSLQTAHSIIIPSPEGDDPDSSVIKALLAITNNPNRRPEPYHIVAEIRNPKNREVAQIVGRDEVELVLVGDLVARITAQICRQPGLSVVYTELLDFEGDEIYFHAEPALTGKTFGEALLAYEDCTAIGIYPKNGKLQLNPPMETVIQDGDQIIAIAEDDDAIRLSGRTDVGIHEEAIHSPKVAEARPERTLILGWNWHAPSVINELDRYVAPGSVVTVVADCADGAAEIARRCAGLRNQTVHFHLGNTTDRHTLDGLAIETYNHVIILCYCDTLDAQQADARTLITLLHLRDIAERTGHPFSIVSEMMDVRNRNLAEVTRADDFIVSTQIISLILAQVSENKALNAVFTDLFNPEGSEIYLKPAADYVRLNGALNFYTVVEAARRRSEVALGYWLHAHANDAAKAYGVVLNPDKSAPVTFSEGDRIIVLAGG
ncbi:MAG: potassium transporter TrkA [Chloroflexi bacterium]|nr:potassium transporter TrkA [Chloroflexota bacterium]